MAKAAKDTYVIIPARFSYPHLFSPYAGTQGQEAKYSILLLIPKSDEATIGKIKSAIAAATEAGKPKWGGKIPAKLHMPLRDGDEEHPDEEEYKGMYFMNASTKRRPAVVDNHRNPIEDQEDVYGGCYGKVSINFFPYAASGNNGIAAGLQNVQKLRDGERLDGGRSAMDDFEDEEDQEEMPW